jgi:uncharacterized membrane protein
MFDDVVLALTVLAALGSGLIGGVFFAFSTFIMAGLARIAPPQGIAAMQSINVTVLNPWFLLPFVGTAALSAVLAVAGFFDLDETESILRISGGALYLIGTFLVTGALNVPRNDALAAVDPDSAEGANVWKRYLSEWTTWNTVRTIAALAASVVLTVALMVD